MHTKVDHQLVLTSVALISFREAIVIYISWGSDPKATAPQFSFSVLWPELYVFGDFHGKMYTAHVSTSHQPLTELSLAFTSTTGKISLCCTVFLFQRCILRHGPGSLSFVMKTKNNATWDM